MGALVGLLLLREPPAVEELGDPARPLRDRRLWRLCAGSTFYVFAQIAITSFLVLYLHENAGSRCDCAAGGVLALVSVLGGVLRIVVGRVSDRMRTRVVPLRRLGLALAAAIGLTAALVEAPDAVLVPALVAAGALSADWNGLSFTAAAELAGRRSAAPPWASEQTALAAGCALAPVPFAALVGASSWQAGFAVLAALPLVGVWTLGPLTRRTKLEVVKRRFTAAVSAAACASSSRGRFAAPTCATAPAAASTPAASGSCRAASPGSAFSSSRAPNWWPSTTPTAVLRRRSAPAVARRSSAARGPTGRR